MRMYRPLTNVVTRPTAGIGKGYSLVGHHEILIPLLAAALRETPDPALSARARPGHVPTPGFSLQAIPHSRPRPRLGERRAKPAGVAQVVRASVS